MKLFISIDFLDLIIEGVSLFGDPNADNFSRPENTAVFAINEN